MRPVNLKTEIVACETRALNPRGSEDEEARYPAKRKISTAILSGAIRFHLMLFMVPLLFAPDAELCWKLAAPPLPFRGPKIWDARVASLVAVMPTFPLRKLRKNRNYHQNRHGRSRPTRLSSIV